MDPAESRREQQNDVFVQAVLKSFSRFTRNRNRMACISAVCRRHRNDVHTLSFGLTTLHSYAVVTTAIRLRCVRLLFDCISTALRQFDDLCYYCVALCKLDCCCCCCCWWWWWWWWCFYYFFIASVSRIPRSLEKIGRKLSEWPLLRAVVKHKGIA